MTPLSEDEAEGEAVGRRQHLPAALLLLPMIAAYALLTWTRGDMNDWAAWPPRLAAGEYKAVWLHMFAHGGVLHLLFNGAALVALTPAVMDRLGPLSPRTLAAFLVLFLVSGLAGLALWLALPQAVPMLGASGAILGLLGFILRQPDPSQGRIPLFGPDMARAFLAFAKLHVPLVILFAIPLLFGASVFGLAWEAHLGGFIAGLLLHGPVLRLAGGYPTPATPAVLPRS